MEELNMEDVIVDTVFKNRCSFEISVAYCSPGKKISGKLCGENDSEHNPYYTHMLHIDEGDSRSKWGLGEVNYAVCRGYINGWSSKGKFVSRPDGSFSCQN